jgi:hypothetical protein
VPDVHLAQEKGVLLHVLMALAADWLLLLLVVVVVLVLVVVLFWLAGPGS